jgi:ribosomal protein L44E
VQGKKTHNIISMNSQVQKVEIELHCIRCQRRIRWAWMITYKSFRYTRLVYVCSECGQIIKVTNAAKELTASVISPSEREKVSPRAAL